MQTGSQLQIFKEIVEASKIQCRMTLFAEALLQWIHVAMLCSVDPRCKATVMMSVLGPCPFREKWEVILFYAPVFSKLWLAMPSREPDIISADAAFSEQTCFAEGSPFVSGLY